MFLEIENIHVALSGKPVLDGLSLSVDKGEVLAVIGPPGCGKSTVLHAVFGLAQTTIGEIRLLGRDIANRPPDKNLNEGIVLVPQGGRVFRTLSVSDNLRLAAYSLRDAAAEAERIDQVFSFFPRLKERFTQTAGSLSGGERQMLALGMALMLVPRLLLLDEPSTGLSPILTEQVLTEVRRMSEMLECTVLAIEQNVKNAVSLGDRVSVMRRGRVSSTFPGRENADIQALLDAYTFKHTAFVG